VFRELPFTDVLKFSPWPDDFHGLVEMQFRLTYQGQLPSNRHKVQKHAIRQKIHRQLAELWKVDRFLSSVLSHPEHYRFDGERVNVLDQFARCGYRFVPLIGGRFSRTACALDILFLRRDAPGNLVTSGSGGGDIDNRIKVLFDALRMPQDCTEVAGTAPQPDEDPFFCLLKDDNLITEVKVTTDRLLAPLENAEHINDVHLIIHVRTLITEHRNMGGYASTPDSYDAPFA
jgi:hypothetical protein